MKKSKIKRIAAVFCVLVLLVGLLGSIPASAAKEDWPNYSGVQTVTNPNGLVLAIHETSGVTFLYDAATGYYFKDLNKNHQVDPYEDWRKSVDERVENLLSLMDIDSKIALMAHNGSASQGFRMQVQRNSGKGSFADNDANGNGQQKICEASAYGIPYSWSSDPRHTGASDSGNNEDPVFPALSLSRWPNTLGLANTFSPEWHRKFGETIATEYRAQQITQQLGPLYDMATDPRWGRIESAVTEDYDLLVDLVQAEVTGMQTTETTYADYGLPAGWGKDSVSAMAKHMLGTGSGEFGYEGHTQMGGWSVYPGNGWRKMTDAMCAAGGIGTQPKDSPSQVNAVMTQYSIATNQYPTGILGDKGFTTVGGAFSSYLMTDILNNEKGWHGMITSDWGVYGTGASSHGVRNEHGMNETSRILVSWVAGMDQLGGYSSFSNMKAAYNLGITGDPARQIPAYGVEYMNALVDRAAGHALRTIFKLGLFENPYVDPDWSDEIVGNSELVELGYGAHQASIVMLKNANNVLPKTDKTATVYTAQVGTGSSSWTLDRTILARSYNVPSEIMNAGTGAMSLENKQAAAAQSDFAIIKFTGPNPGNGTANQAQTLQFAPYTKTVGREVSIGGYWFHANGSNVQAWEVPNPLAGDYKQNMSNIGYSSSGQQDVLNMVMETRQLMGDKPIIAILDYRHPPVCAEFEPYVDAIIANVQGADSAYLDVISGRYEPTGMLAVTFPRNMAYVEMSAEDVPDTTPYVDSDGNVYQFGFGLNYTGRIVDARTQKYIGLSTIKNVTLKAGQTVNVPIELLKYKYGPAGVAATIYYDKSLLELTSVTAASGFLLAANGDHFMAVTSNGTSRPNGGTMGYATFKAVDTPDNNINTTVTFAMDGAAYDADLNPTMARFADVTVSVDGDAPLPGDISLDGNVNVADVVLLLQYLAGNATLTPKQLAAADVNGDGSVNIADAIIIMQMGIH